ncbi:MAG: hypothetical protein ACK6D7_22930, partial [Acidobacteriota bacterium]
MLRILLLGLLPTLALASGRELAEWVIRWEGAVTIEGGSRPLRSLAELPPGEVTITGIDLTGSVMPPPELKRLAGLTSLRDLFLPGPVWNP